MITTTLFRIIQSELIKKGHSEFETEEKATDIFSFGKFVFYEDEYQFTEKIMSYDTDVSYIIDGLFHGLSLNNKVYDNHFKRMFLYRFVNRQINRQTLESFKMELMNVFLTNKDYIDRVYNDSENFILQRNKSVTANEQKNNQKNKSNTVTDNRQAFADLPQSSVNLDVDRTTMDSATDNTISRNKQNVENDTDGTTKGKTLSDSDNYSLDELIKSSQLFENIMNTFDQKCFLQVW